MNKENKIRQPLTIIGVCILLLFAASFIQFDEDIDIYGLQLRGIDILSDLREQPSDDYYDNYYKEDNSSDEGALLLENNLDKPKYNLASFAFFEGLKELASTVIDATNAPGVNSINYLLKERDIEGNVDQLKYFFQALKNGKGKKIRVAHYGDSQIEGDYVTNAIRDKLQKKFGGQGVGYLALTSEDILFRITTDHKFPKADWESASIFISNRDKLPVGIGGEVFVPKKNTWVSYQTRSNFSTIKKFSKAKLFYSDAKSSSINYSFGGGASKSERLSPGGNVKVIEMDAGADVSSVKIDFPTANQAYFYGASLEDGPGIYVDNFPLRGNTGEDLQKIPMDKLKDFEKIMDYKLIILEFGKNAMGTNTIRYEKEMTDAIEHIKKAFPNTSFLLISVQDSGFQTGSRTTSLLSTQIRIAKKTNIAFWNLFEAMGGKNSMSKWVKNNPPLASADHTHLNNEGAAKIGEMIADALLQAYKNYK